WKVLDPDSGLVLCTGAIDAQAYHNYIIYDRYNDEYWGDADPVQKYRANDYAHSDIRAWLNEEFINTAFSTAQQENIKVSELDNSRANSGSDTYVYASTSDKIFFLSYSDVTAYGFDSDRNAQDEARRMAPSDYAKCQGIWENTTKTSFWWLRAPNSSGSVHTVNPYGMLAGNSLPCSTSVGVVPALRMQELQDDPTGAPPKVAPEMTLTAEAVIYGEDAVITATLPANATGSVTFTLTGSSNNYSFTNDSITDGVAQITQKLNADSYTVTATYSGDGQYLTTTATATLTVNPATPEITITAKSLNDAGTAYEITVTKPADSTQGVMVYAVYSGLPAFALSIRNDKFENGSYTFRFPDVFEDSLSDNVSGEFELSAVYDGRNDQNYQDNIVELAITLGCAHVWNTPTWDWTDVDNPTYSTTCTLCANGQTSGSVASTKGTRVAATVEADAYTPYTVTVTLDGQTFNDTFHLTEPGTMLAARKAAFDQYKADQKQAADAMAKTGDSAACAALIDAAKSAIDGVTYDESKSLDENKATVDDAANLDQLAADLTDQRAADEVEKKINDIGTVALTDESKQKIDDAKEAYDNLTDKQKALVGNKDTLETAEEAYQLLEDKDNFEKYKDELKQAAEDKRKDGDSAESQKLIDDAVAAIDAQQYDETKSLDENKQAVDLAADLDTLTEQLEEHRETHTAVFMADGKEVARVPYTIDTKSITEPAVPVKGGYTGAWPKYELKAGGVEINAVYTKNDALVITDNAKEQGEDRVLTFMETVTFTTDTSALPEGATLCWYVNGEAVTAEKSVTVESPKDDYTVQVKAFAKDGTLYAESDVLAVKVDHSFRAKLVYFFNLAFNPVFNALKKAAPSFFSFLVALIKAVASALVSAVKTVA
ncbi:MAG: Ig-like domain repeat protein, partial [Clostridia bacterium]|nr:Ig-like domain repeat protein [Clostridia bacterium]